MVACFALRSFRIQRPFVFQMPLLWRNLTETSLRIHYTNDCCDVLALVEGKFWDKTTAFLVRYVFQAGIHAIWKERHGNRCSKKIQARINSLHGCGQWKYRVVGSNQDEWYLFCSLSAKLLKHYKRMSQLQKFFFFFLVNFPFIKRKEC